MKKFHVNLENHTYLYFVYLFVVYLLLVVKKSGFITHLLCGGS